MLTLIIPHSHISAWQNRPPSFSFVTHIPPFPPTLSLPPPTTSIPIPSSAYWASRSACSPQWHHPVAEAAGGARVWGNTCSCRNHLSHSGRWLTRVMSRQLLLLHIVCVYFVYDRDRPVTSGKVQWRLWKGDDNRERLVTPWENVPWWQGLWMWASPPSLQLKSHWLRLWAMKNALRVAVAGRENIPPKDLRMETRPWMRLQCTAAAEDTVPSSPKDASNMQMQAAT